VQVELVCPSGGPGCTVPPTLVASCGAGDVATGGAAWRDIFSNPSLPLQDMPLIPVPGSGAVAPTGFTTGQFNISAGETIRVMAICADLTP
jgi:hypothetical protein